MSFRALLSAGLFLLPCSMALPSISSLSERRNPAHSKRLTSVLECDPRAEIPNYPDQNPLAEGDPAKTFVGQVATFKSLTSLCGQYPAGMGYYCPPAGGALLVQTPRSQLYSFLGPPDSSYLKDACLTNCYCVQIAPDDPDPSSSKPASAQCLADVDESDTEDEIDAAGCMDTYHDPGADDGVYCDETGYLYGHPIDADCKSAASDITEGIDNVDESYEFLAVGAQSVYNGFRIAQTPYNWTSGTCYIQVSMLEGDSSELENWDYIWGRANAIREKCVAGLGVGGSAKAGDVSDGEHQSIGIYVSGIQSKTKQMLDMKFDCFIDADGNYSCEDDDDAPPAKKQKTSSPSSPNSAVAPPAGNRLSSGAQSGSCVSHKDCDYKNGYTCAATKTAVDDFPVDSTWGTYTCKLISDAATAAAAAAAYVALGSACRGRCFLDTNGTLDILANTTTTTNTSTAGPEPDSVMPPMLVGPCNCTYVSAACVLSTTGIVYEDPSAKINTLVGAPNGTVCCDGTTGLWRNSSVVRDTPAANPLCPAAGGVQAGVSSSGSASGSVSGSSGVRGGSVVV